MGFHAVRVFFAAGAFHPVVRLVILPDSVVVLVLHVLRLFIATDCAGVGVLRAVLVEHALTKGMGFHAARVFFAAGAFHPVVRLVIVPDGVGMGVSKPGDFGHLSGIERRFENLELIDSAVEVVAVPALVVGVATDMGSVVTQANGCGASANQLAIHIEVGTINPAHHSHMGPLVCSNLCAATVNGSTIQVVGGNGAIVQAEPHTRRISIAGAVVGENCLGPTARTIPLDPSGKGVLLQAVEHVVGEIHAGAAATEVSGLAFLAVRDSHIAALGTVLIPNLVLISGAFHFI